MRFNQVCVLFMHLINLILNYLYRKYGLPLHNIFENETKGTSHLNP